MGMNAQWRLRCVRSLRSALTLLSATTLLMTPCAHAAVFTGTIKFVIRIQIVSTDLGSSAIKCSATVSGGQQNSHEQFTYTNSIYTETKSVVARRSGNTASCTVNIPYRWVLDESLRPSWRHSVSAQTVDSETNKVTRSVDVSDLLREDTVPVSGFTSTLSYRLVL